MNSRDHVFTSCLISAPFGAELGALPQVLDQAGIHWEWAKSVVTYSERLPGDLRKIIRGVDFVVAVLFGDPSDLNTMFEVGIAVGMGKPVLLILTTDGYLPFNVDALPHLRASLTDGDAIALHLDLLIRSAGRGFRYQLSGQARRTSMSQTKIEFGTSVVYDKHPDNALEAEIANLVREAGGRVLLHPRLNNPDQRFTPDILFWLPAKDPELLNPAVVEVKSFPLMPMRLAELEERLSAFLQATGVRTGLIVTRNIESRMPVGFRGSPSLNIFVLDFENFRELLKTGRLADHLRQERNRAAHGLR